jgi:regulator of ribonuclease activity A
MTERPAAPATADLLDAHPDLAVCEPALVSFGGVAAFCGPIATVVAPEDNTLVRATLETPGEGRVLVVDGLGSVRCALVGDNLAQLAIDNDWAGIVVNGAIRDSAVIDAMDVGVKALATNPRKSVKRDLGVAGATVTFLGVTFAPGWWCYADDDGVVVSPTAVES